MRRSSSGTGGAIFSFIMPAVIMVVLISIWNGFVISVIWNWFMPKIFGLVQLSIAQAIGIALMTSVLVSGTGKGKSDDDMNAVPALIRPFLPGIVALAMGFIVQMFI